MRLGGKPLDIAVVTERNRQALRVYTINPESGELRETGDIPVFSGEKGRQGRITGEKVRTFGNFSGSKEIEAVAVDDELGYVCYSDEDTAIRQWRADPDHPDAGREIAVFGRDGFAGNREGIAIYSKRGGKGYVVCADQRPGDSARLGPVLAPDC